MDYNTTKEKIDSLTKEIFDIYIESLKCAVKEKGKTHSMFYETLYVDVSKYEIEYNYESTLDEVYYIPTKDELGFIVWSDEMHTKIYRMSEFKQKDIEIMSLLFYYLMKCQ